MQDKIRNKEIYIPKIKLNIKFLIGKNATDNFNIIDKSNENDLWFHINDSPSCHVIACIHEYNIDKKDLKYIIKQGGIICKQYSKYKSDKNVEIIYTSIKNIQKTNIIGTVLTQNTKSILII